MCTQDSSVRIFFIYIITWLLVSVTNVSAQAPSLSGSFDAQITIKSVTNMVVGTGTAEVIIGSVLNSGGTNDTSMSGWKPIVVAEDIVNISKDGGCARVVIASVGVLPSCTQ